jgi:hypothetical protein
MATTAITARTAALRPRKLAITNGHLKARTTLASDCPSKAVNVIDSNILGGIGAEKK